MRKAITFIMVLTFLITSISVYQNPVYAASVNITNDSVWLDTSGNEIKCQGGSILKVGNTYYWYGMELYGGSTGPGHDVGVGDWTLRNCKVYSSTDLKNWTFQGNILSPGSPSGLSSADWVGRPNVLYNASTNKYVMITEWNNGSTRNGIAYFQSSSPTGPFTWVNYESTFDGYTIGDIGSYQENGIGYLVLTYDRGGQNYTIGIGQLASDYLSMSSKIYSVTSGGREANSIIKKGSTYYWMNSGTDWWYSTATKYSTATSLAGPWTSFTNVGTSPSSTNSFNTQHDFVIPITGSSTTSYIYCGDRYSNFHGIGVGRVAWYPLTFDSSGVPTINGYQNWTIDVVTGAWSIPSKGTNLVTNPGFEANGGTTQTPSGWTTWSNGNSDADYVEVNHQYAGTYSLAHWKTTAYQVYTSQTITGLTNGLYTMKIWIKSSGGQNACSVGAKISGGTEVSTSLTTATATYTQKVLTNINVTNGQCELFIWSDAKAGNWINIDNVEFYKQ